MATKKIEVEICDICERQFGEVTRCLQYKCSVCGSIHCYYCKAKGTDSLSGDHFSVKICNKCGQREDVKKLLKKYKKQFWAKNNRFTIELNMLGEKKP